MVHYGGPKRKQIFKEIFFLIVDAELRVALVRFGFVVIPGGRYWNNLYYMGMLVAGVVKIGWRRML